MSKRVHLGVMELGRGERLGTLQITKKSNGEHTQNPIFQLNFNLFQK